MPVHRHPIANAKTSGPLSRIPLDAGLIERLRLSYEKAREQDIRLAEIFYAKLFAAAPHLRTMFSTDVRDQARKLTAALDMIVANLASPDENAAMLTAMGRRHAGYGARPEHYELVTDLLVDSMSELLGGQAKDQTLEEWRTALRLISRQMIAAGEPGPNS